jgi:type IV secretory pathway VirB10-like protein
MRAGVIISAVSHIVLVALALFGTPKLFDSQQLASIEVDLVPSEEVETAKEKPPEDKPAEWNPLAQNIEPAPPPPPEAEAQPQPKPPEVNQPAQGPQGSPPPPQAQTPWIFDPVNIPALLDLPNAPDKGFDSESTTAANLSPAQSTRVVLRIYLRRDGRLAGEPVLIEASASRDGPPLLQAAIRTLKDCQPYGFLPADKYREWRMLDLSFSPREMAGG